MYDHKTLALFAALHLLDSLAGNEWSPTLQFLHIWRSYLEPFGRRCYCRNSAIRFVAMETESSPTGTHPFSEILHVFAHDLASELRVGCLGNNWSLGGVMCPSALGKSGAVFKRDTYQIELS